MNVSIFHDMTCKLPVPGLLEGVADLIRTDEKLAVFTRSYRQTGSKTFKNESQLFAVPCLFEGGKGRSNIRQLTGMSLVDFDHVVSSSTDFTPLPSPLKREKQFASLTEESSDKPLNERTNLSSPLQGEIEGVGNLPNDKSTSEFRLNSADKINPSADSILHELKAKVIADPHTLMSYVTMSGNGLRVIFTYEIAPEFSGVPKDEEEVKKFEAYYQQAFYAGNAYYEKLLGAKADMQCKNITRLSGLAHDPDVFLRPPDDAVPFTTDEISTAATAYVRQSKEEKQMQRIQAYYDTLIAPQLAKDNIVFRSGSHNNYVMRVGYKLAERRFPKKAAIRWANSVFGKDYPDTEQVITSCFANASPYGNCGGGGGSGNRGDSKYASVDVIKSFLDGHIRLRYNEITARVEYSLNTNDIPVNTNGFVANTNCTNCTNKDPANPNGESARFVEFGRFVFEKENIPCSWQPISDRIVNSLWTEMSQVTRVVKQDIYTIIESDYVPLFNPFKAYFANLLTKRQPSKNPDEGFDAQSTLMSERRAGAVYIPSTMRGEGLGESGGALLQGKEGRGGFRKSGFLKESQSPFGAIQELAQTVRVKGGEQEQMLWYRYLKKWLVSMVASWLSDDVVNNVILVLIGEQGAFKTTWFNYLLPPELRRYFYTKTNANRMSKDDLLTLAQYGLVCCEELDTMRPAELNQLKAVVTMPSIDERAAYAHFHEHRKHIASFCGTGNNPQFLSDPTGNRRWLPFEVESIISPRDNPFDYDAIYAEAYTLYKCGFRYWFEKDEIQELNRHNRKFETPRLEQELVDLYFRRPGPEEVGEFMSVARALQIISAGISQKLSAVYTGRAFSELGFNRVRTKRSRGFIVVCRTGEEMKAYQRRQGLDAEPDTAPVELS